jgi:hypothetical protein
MHSGHFKKLDCVLHEGSRLHETPKSPLAESRSYTLPQAVVGIAKDTP